MSGDGRIAQISDFCSDGLLPCLELFVESSAADNEAFDPPALPPFTRQIYSLRIFINFDIKSL